MSVVVAKYDEIVFTAFVLSWELRWTFALFRGNVQFPIMPSLQNNISSRSCGSGVWRDLKRCSSRRVHSELQVKPQHLTCGCAAAGPWSHKSTQVVTISASTHCNSNDTILYKRISYFGLLLNFTVCFTSSTQSKLECENCLQGLTH